MKNNCQREYTPLYEKGIKHNQNKLMETTQSPDSTPIKMDLI